MNRFLSFLVCFCACVGMTGTTKAQVTSFFVDDFGAVATPGVDSGLAIRNALAAAMATPGPSELVFGAGEYFLGRDPSAAPDIAGTAFRGFGLTIENASDLVIRGSGPTSMLTFTDPMIAGVAIVDSNQVSLENLKFDYDPVPFTQGTITALDTAADWYEINLDAGYIDFANPAMTSARSQWGVVVDQDATGNNYGPEVVFSDSWQPLGGSSWRVNTQPGLVAQSGMQVGNRFVHLARDFDPALVIHGGTDIEVTDVSVYSSVGTASYVNQAERVTFTDYRVEPRPGTNRLLSTNADGIHARANRGDLVVDGALMTGMADDGINFHNAAINVTQVVSPQVVVASLAQSSLRVGDHLLVLNTDDPANPTEVEITALSGTFPWAMTVTFDQPVAGMQASPEFSEGTNIYNLSESNEGFVVRNSTFENHRGRDVVISATDGVVEGNVFANNQWINVLMTFESEQFGEGPTARNIIIRDNDFVAEGDSQTPSAIYLVPGQLQPGQPAMFSNILIEGNRFTGLTRPALTVAQSEQVKFWNNGFLEGEPNPKILNLDGSEVSIIEGGVGETLFANALGDRHLTDLDGDDLGDEAPGTDTVALPGDIESDGNPRELRYFFGFDLNETHKSRIAAGVDVSLTLTLTTVSLPITGTTLDIYALPGKTTSIGVPSDYESGTLLVDDAFSFDDANGTSRTFDISAFAAANAGNGVLSFVARMDGVNLPDFNGNNNFFFLGTPEDATESTQPFLTVSFILPGDFTDDGKVDGADFLAWQRGESPNPQSAADLALWEANFGNSVTAALAATRVPEPTSLSMLLLGIMRIWSFRRLRSGE